ncbi:unnamed protein product [Cuscuta europaea]|uniref:Uncharacterized protein n=1 Tax=Cuscuta europaea TaxID=41803 RepID=A0A9P1EJM4_CUSEU|nr:unnamed protein product [Cuscuta europaea]
MLAVTHSIAWSPLVHRFLVAKVRGGAVFEGLNTRLGLEQGCDGFVQGFRLAEILSFQPVKTKLRREVKNNCITQRQEEIDILAQAYERIENEVRDNKLVYNRLEGRGWSIIGSSPPGPPSGKEQATMLLMLFLVIFVCFICYFFVQHLWYNF